MQKPTIKNNDKTPHNLQTITKNKTTSNSRLQIQKTEKNPAPNNNQQPVTTKIKNNCASSHRLEEIPKKGKRIGLDNSEEGQELGKRLEEIPKKGTQQYKTDLRHVLGWSVSIP